MHEPKWTKELVEKCRNHNGVVLDYMSQDARRALDLLCFKNLQVYKLGMWQDVQEVPINSYPHRAYRLHPDFQVEIPIEKKYYDLPLRVEYGFIKASGELATNWLNNCRFIGFVYPDGSLYGLPTRTADSCKDRTIASHIRLLDDSQPEEK